MFEFCGGVVWCPFDTEESQFVKILRSRGYDVVATHISNGQDFFETDPPTNCKAIISNPPFSIKKQIMYRIKELNIPFVLILPCLWINDGIPFDFGYQMIWWRKRVHFMTTDGEKNKPRTTCFALSNGLLKQDLIIIYDNIKRGL